MPFDMHFQTMVKTEENQRQYKSGQDNMCNENKIIKDPYASLTAISGFYSCGVKNYIRNQKQRGKKEGDDIQELMHPDILPLYKIQRHEQQNAARSIDHCIQPG